MKKFISFSERRFNNGLVKKEQPGSFFYFPGFVTSKMRRLGIQYRPFIGELRFYHALDPTAGHHH